MVRAYTIQLPDTAFSVFRKEPEDFIREMKYAAVVKWYEQGDISQSKAAEVTELSRYEFLLLLSRYHVSILQDTAEQVEEELRYAHS